MSQQRLLNQIREKYENDYRKRTPKSQVALEEACKYLPGGETRGEQWFSPHPIWCEKAYGCKITDLDGNEYIDFHNNATSMVLGYGNPKVIAAIKQQLEKGPTAMGVMAPNLIRWAEILCRRVDSVDKVRFANSGTEAVMMAVRAARAFTGKDKLLRIEEGFHGFYDPLVYPPDTNGLPISVLADSIAVPWNNKEAAERAITENKDKLAAMIVEGYLGSGGRVAPRDGYLEFLRKVTAANNVLLILDEIQSFRLDYGGIQRIYGIKPDLTVFGKIIGGGLPVGAFGGREDIMQQFSPKVYTVYHSGTFNGNPVTAAAGIAALEQLDTDEIARINKLGESLTSGMGNVFTKLKIKGQVTGIGSLRGIHFSQVPVVDARTAGEANKDVLAVIQLMLLERGIFTSRKCLFAISTPMTQKEIDTVVQAIDEIMTELKPHIEQIWPELIK